MLAPSRSCLLGDRDRGQPAGALVEQVGGERREAAPCPPDRPPRPRRARPAPSTTIGSAWFSTTSSDMPFLSLLRLATGGLNVGSVVGCGRLRPVRDAATCRTAPARAARSRQRARCESETRQRAAHHFTTFLPGLIVSTTRAVGLRYFAAASLHLRRRHRAVAREVLREVVGVVGQHVVLGELDRALQRRLEPVEERRLVRVLRALELLGVGRGRRELRDLLADLLDQALRIDARLRGRDDLERRRRASRRRSRRATSCAIFSS